MVQTPSLPSGRVTFCFTDIEGSTRILRTVGDRFIDLLDQHKRTVQAAIERYAGVVVHTEGDSFFIVFADATDAVQACADMQRALAAINWPPGGQIRIRIGLHCDDATPVAGDYVSLAVHQAARVADAAHGGQVLFTAEVVDQVRDRLPAELAYIELGEYRLKDFDTPAKLFELRAPGLRAGFPELRAPPSARHNLPRQRTSFVGRERELDSVRAMLGDSRLLTLVAAGGAGKTRLAIEAALALESEFPDGVWMAELAPVSDPALVPSVVAATVGVPEERGRPLVDVIVEGIGERRCLLVLDNCEHVLDATATLVDALLDGTEGLRVLATSREALRVRGEQLWPLQPLELPADDAAAPHVLLDTESIRLFVERARLVHPEFALDQRNAQVVAQVCRQLDGIPLALELAAARAGNMSISELASRLDDRFLLLTTGVRTDLPRQRSLRALIDWSYDLLDPAEQALFRRLAVFRGGFTLDAAAEVVAFDGVGTEDLPLHLASLVSKSLVQWSDDDAGRYRLLVSIWLYAREHLVASDEAAATYRRHHQWALRVARAGDAGLAGNEQAVWLDRLEAEHDNIRTALDWSLREDPTGALELAAAAGQFLFIRGHVEEGRRVLQAALDAGPPDADLPRARTQLALGRHLSQSQAVGQLGHRLLDESLRTFRAHDDRAGVAATLLSLGEEARVADDVATARALLDECLQVASEINDHAMVALALVRLGYLTLEIGRYDDARAYCHRALAITRPSGDQRRTGVALHCLSLVAWEQGRLDEVRELATEAVRLFRELGDRRSMTLSLLRVAAAEVERAERAQAAEHLVECLESVREIRETAILPETLVNVAVLAAADDAAAAAEVLGAARAYADRLNVPLPESELRRVVSARGVLHERLGAATVERLMQAGELLAEPEVYDVALTACRASLPSRSCPAIPEAVE